MVQQFETDYFSDHKKALEAKDAEIAELKKQLEHEKACRRNDLKYSIFSQHTLPEYPDLKVISMPLHKLKDFNAHYTELAQFISEMLGVPTEKLCMADMMFRRTKNLILEDKITTLKEMLAKAERALEKYGDKKNWRYWSNHDVGAHDSWLDFRPDHFCKTSDELGGYLARQTIAELQAMKKEME